MTGSRRLLCLLPLILGCVACNSTDEGSGPPPDPGSDDDARNGGVVRCGDDGDCEVLSMLVASDGEPAGEGRVVKVWIGDTACPPDVTSAPTYDSAGLVALPWRPGVPVRLSREVTRDGEFTVYTLVIVPKGDGCFCVYEGCKKVRRPARGESVPFSFDLRRVESNLDLRLLGAEREPIPAAGVNKTILILREGRR